MNILEAMDSPRLFGPHFASDSWDPWRVWLASLMGLPLTDTQLLKFQQHTGRIHAPTERFREAALVTGRRAGKSRCLALLGTYLATMRDYRPYLSAGEVGKIVVLASDKDQAQVIFRYIKGFLDEIPAFKGMKTGETETVIELAKQKVEIEVKAASYKGLRGFTYIAVLADEVCFWSPENSSNPDSEILAAIRPGLSTIPESILLLASSPHSKRGELFELWRDYHGKDDADVLVWQSSTREMNKLADPKEEEKAFKRDPFRARSEWLGLWRDDITGYVSRDVVESCIEPGCTDRPYMLGVQYKAFADVAGGSGSDSFTAAIAHREGSKAVLDKVIEIRPPFGPDEATRQVAEALKSYRVSSIMGDRYGGSWPAERFAVHGIRYEPAELPKSSIYQNFLPMLNERTVELLDNRVLVDQLCLLEQRTARGGRSSIDHPPGLGHHDDVCNSVAGALVQLDLKRDPMAVWRILSERPEAMINKEAAA